jgi:beta-glucosidase
MTLDEKLTIIHGTAEDASTYQGQAGYLAGVPRLGIPPVRFADGPPGVLTRVPSIAPTATMGLAATFSRADAQANGELIGREARSHGIGVALQPFINIDRDLAAGRSYNTFGEDPFLTGQIAAAEVIGIQSQGVMAQAKHYIGYDTDGTDVVIDPQTLHEIYAAPFDWTVKAGVASIMCSYNRINGPYACGNRDLLTGVLRDEIGFKGFVTSDWGAIHATDFINAGVDMEMPGTLREAWAGPSYFVNAPVTKQPEPAKDAKPQPVPLTDLGLPEEPEQKPWDYQSEPPPATDLKRLLAEGKVSLATIDRAARRVLLQMDRFGFLDGREKLSITASDTVANAAVIERTAEDAAVLLKNEGGALPLKATQLQNIVLIGPGAGQTIAVGMTGEKAVGLPERFTGTVAALRSRAHDSGGVHYAVADDMEGVPIPASFLSHAGGPGLLRTDAQAPSTGNLNFTVSSGMALPSGTSATWKGSLRIPSGGTYRLHLQVLGCYATLLIDDAMVARNQLMWIHGNITQAAQDNVLPTLDGLDNLRVALPLSAGEHPVEIRVVPDGSGSPVQVRLNWVTPQQQADNYHAAIEAAKQAQTAVVFAWSRNRPVFGLPGDQDKLIAAVAAVNPNTIVVLNVSQPVAMPWLADVKAVLQMWWPGNEGGEATAKILIGEASPAGRLPFTWPRRLEDTPVGDPAHRERTAKGVGGKTTFSEGIFVGYRWFDAKKIKPLFPFGFGLSYSSFRWSGLKLLRTADGVDASMTVENAGHRTADEVVQLYIDKPADRPAGAMFAESVLGGFERVHLAPGESKVVSVHLPLRVFQFWSAARTAWVTPPGRRAVRAGESSRDAILQGTITLSDDSMAKDGIR